MKKLILTLTLILCVFNSASSYSYPTDLNTLLIQFDAERTLLEIRTISSHIYKGYLLRVADDYIVFKGLDDDVVIIITSNIEEVVTLN